MAEEQKGCCQGALSMYLLVRTPYHDRCYFSDVIIFVFKFNTWVPFAGQQIYVYLVTNINRNKYKYMLEVTDTNLTLKIAKGQNWGRCSEIGSP